MYSKTDSDRKCATEGCSGSTSWGARLCDPCYLANKEEDRKRRARLARKCRSAAKAAREAMPQAAAWCDRARRVGRVHYLIPHVARSGMSRHIELFVTQPDGTVDPFWPDREPEQEKGETREAFRSRCAAYKKAFRSLSWSWKHRCFVVGGCGMDMVFATMDRLGYVFGHYDMGNAVRREGLSRAE